MSDLIDARRGLMLSRTEGGEPAHLVMALLTTARRIDAACAELLSRHGMSEGRFAVLLAADTEARLTPALLAERLSVSRATITGLIDGLERQGLIERVVDPGDRRSLTVHPTPAGRRLIGEVLPLRTAWLARLTTDISPADCDAGMRLMATLQHGLACLIPEDQMTP